MDIQKIKELALANGFKLKEQASGNMDLNAYVYDFANAVEQAAKAQAVPDQLDVNSILHDIDCYFDNCLSNTERTANNLLQSIYEKLSGEVKAQEQAND